MGVTVRKVHDETRAKKRRLRQLARGRLLPANQFLLLKAPPNRLPERPK